VRFIGLGLLLRQLTLLPPTQHFPILLLNLGLMVTLQLEDTILQLLYLRVLAVYYQLQLSALI
jgi:hypothetical protein